MIARLVSQLLLLLLAGAAVETAAARDAAARTDWERTLDRAVRGVVALRVSVPRAFDTQRPAYEQATGFVVDAQRGLILTNRHVVKPGPVVAEAVFEDHEEVAVRAIYRDPVHDFGFYRYDPAEVRFMEPVALPLRPELARVGTEIRVVGNDAGEKLSILAGTLARLDRDAPDYGHGYNDFNTFYLQAASSTSGGSSGSPVLEVGGGVVALNAGGSRRASASFYLPLDRVVRALERIQKGEPVSRGTLHSVFLHRSYDEVRRLGLRPETEAAVRAAFPKGNGLLVVAEVVPEGVGDGRLRVGDVLLRLEGEPINAFTPLESLLDERVGGRVRLEVERGGQPLALQIPVADLHAVTPDEYLEMGGAVLTPLSYQLARLAGVPIRGVHVALPGYALSQADIPRHAVITSVAGEPVTSLDDLEAHLAVVPHGTRVPIRYFMLSEPQVTAVGALGVDRRWFPMQRCFRDDATGRWPCRPSPPAPPHPDPVAFAARFPSPPGAAARRLARSLALVEFGVPYRVDGVHGDRFVGGGLVVDAERGLVLVDRETAPVSVGDARITFAGSVSVPGDVAYIDPVHNLAVVSYDPALLGDTPVQSARLASSTPRPGDRTTLVGLGERHGMVSLETRVVFAAAPRLPLADPPRFRQTNQELLQVADDVPTVGGVLADSKGRVGAYWASFSGDEGPTAQSFFAGIPVARIAEIVEPLREGRPVERRALGAELWPLPLSEARDLGLPDGLAAELAAQEGRSHTLLTVERLTAGSDAVRKLEEGDLLVAVGEVSAPSLDDMERAVQAQTVELTIVRNGQILEREVATEAPGAGGTQRFLSWAGALLQRPHRALATQKGIEPEGVYVAWFWYGSPANRSALPATSRIVAVDGVPTPDLDAFLAAVAGRPDRSAVRLRLLDLEGTPDVITLKLDLEYWPTVEFRRQGSDWERIDH
jgi:S1-C subfamily serine protease